MHKNLWAGQLPRERLPFLQIFLNFIITKYLKQEVDDDLSICVTNVAPVASQLEMKRFINVTWSKGNDVTTHNGEVPYGLLSRSCFYCPNL